MTTRVLNKQLHLQQWAEDWKQQMNSGLSMRAWCQIQNISYNTFRSHVNAVRNSFLENTSGTQSPAIQETAETDMTSSGVPKLDIAQVHLEPETTIRQSTQPDIHIELRNMVIDINNTADLDHLGYILGALLNVKF